jgi:hypothetical protein
MQGQKKRVYNRERYFVVPSRPQTFSIVAFCALRGEPNLEVKEWRQVLLPQQKHRLMVVQTHCTNKLIKQIRLFQTGWFSDLACSTQGCFEASNANSGHCQPLPTVWWPTRFSGWAMHEIRIEIDRTFFDSLIMEPF